MVYSEGGHFLGQFPIFHRLYPFCFGNQVFRDVVVFFEHFNVFGVCWVKTHWDELNDDLVGAVLDACSGA